MTKQSNIAIADIPAARAALPELYSAAKKALAQCAELDECKEWSDKAAAMASYAKQAKDTSLRNHALRIQARALRQLGELIKVIPSPPQGQKQKAPSGLRAKSRQRATKEAGLSERQVKTAVRVANVPAEHFEEQIESANPPTVTELARQGTTRRAAEAVPVDDDDDIAMRADHVIRQAVDLLRVMPQHQRLDFRRRLLAAISDEMLKEEPDA